jgi:hypothetical protein
MKFADISVMTTYFQPEAECWEKKNGIPLERSLHSAVSKDMAFRPVASQGMRNNQIYLSRCWVTVP